MYDGKRALSKSTKNRIFKKDSRLILGSRFAYDSDGKTFYFSYNRYPIGDWMSSQAEGSFKPALD